MEVVWFSSVPPTSSPLLPPHKTKQIIPNKRSLLHFARVGALASSFLLLFLLLLITLLLLFRGLREARPLRLAEEIPEVDRNEIERFSTEMVVVVVKPL